MTRTVRIIGGADLVEGIDYHWDGDVLHLYWDEHGPVKLRNPWWMFWRWFWPEMRVVHYVIVAEYADDGLLLDVYYSWPDVVYEGWPQRKE